MDCSMGKIYKITCFDTKLVYIGSTCHTLSSKMYSHIRDYNRGEERLSLVLDHGDYDIQLIEAYPCKSMQELKEREEYYISNTNCINKSFNKKQRLF